MTNSNSHQVSVSISGELLDIFLELKEKLHIHTEAELFRMALKAYYNQLEKQKEEEEGKLKKLWESLENLKARMEALEKE